MPASVYIYIYIYMMLYKNTELKVRLTDGDIGYIDIVAGMFQGDILARYLLIIHIDDVLRTSTDEMKDDGFKLAKERSKITPHKQFWTWSTPMRSHFWKYTHPSLNLPK